MTKKIIKFPWGRAARLKKKMGKGCVPCRTSQRWLRFPARSSGYFDDGEFIEIDVMTYGESSENPRKICSLTVTREDLLQAIHAVPPPDTDA